MINLVLCLQKLPLTVSHLNTEDNQIKVGPGM